MNSEEQNKNIYAPPAGAQSDWEPPHGAEKTVVNRSAIPKVLGILSILFSSCTGIMSAVSLNEVSSRASMSYSYLPRGNGNENREAEILRRLAEHDRKVLFVDSVYGGVFLVMSILLWILGTGLFNYRPWALRWSLRWAAFALLSLAVLVPLKNWFTHPTYEQIQEMANRGVRFEERRGAQYTKGTFNKYWKSGFILIGCFAPYPVVMLSLLTRTAVKQSINQT
jgi:hypothetical protein